MPVERIEVTISQFCEELALDPKRFIAVERKDASTLVLVMEPEDDGEQRLSHRPAE